MKKKKIGRKWIVISSPQEMIFFFFFLGRERKRIASSPIKRRYHAEKTKTKKKKFYTFRVFLRAHFCWLVEKDISLSLLFFCLFFFFPFFV